MENELQMLARALEMAQPGAGQSVMNLVTQAGPQGAQLLAVLARIFMDAEQQSPGAGAQAVIQFLMQQGVLGGTPQPPAPPMDPAMMGPQGAPPPPGAPVMDPNMPPPPPPGAPPPEMQAGAPTQAIRPPQPDQPDTGRQVKAEKKQGPPKYENPDLEDNRYKQKPPTIERIYQVARAGVTMWQARTDRIKEDVACWKGEMPSLLQDGSEVMGPNRLVHQRLTPYTFTERITSMVAWDNDTEMDLPARADDTEHREAAQKTENWLRTQRQNDSKRWRRRAELGDPQPPLERVEAQGMTLLGGVGWFWDIHPEDKEHPYRAKYVPWNELYPVGAEVTRQFVVPLAQLRAECAEVDDYYKESGLDDQDDNRKCRVIGWSDNQGYRHALCWQQEGSGWDACTPPKDAKGNDRERWIVKPDKVLGLGFPFYNLRIAMSTPAIDETADGYRKWVGMGVLTRAVPHFKLVNFVGEMALRGFLRDVEPPTLQLHQPGTDLSKVPTVATEAGDRNFGFKGDEVVNLNRGGTGTADGTTTLNMLASDQQDLVPPAMAGARAGNSGFQQMQTQEAATAVTVGPLLDAMERFYEDLFAQRAQLALRFGKNKANKDNEYFSEYPYRNYRSEIGQYGTLKPADIELSGVDVEVRYKRLSPAEEAAQATMLVQLVNAHLMSTEEALKRRGVREPERAWLQILRDGAMMNPRVLMGLVGKAIMESGDEMLIGAWQEAGMLEALKGGGGSPPAQPGVPSSAGAPSANMPTDAAMPGASANAA